MKTKDKIIIGISVLVILAVLYYCYQEFFLVATPAAISANFPLGGLHAVSIKSYE